MSRRAFVIQPCDLAACIGSHRYKPRDEMLVSYLRLNCREAYERFVCQTGERTKEDAAREVRRKVAAEAGVLYNQAVKTVTAAVANSTDYKAGVAQSLAQVVAQVETMSNISVAEKAVLKEDLQKKIYTGIGTASESAVVKTIPKARVNKDKIEKDIGVAYTPDGDEVTIMMRGQLDAIQKDEDTGEDIVVEIKQRMNRLFKKMVEYERVQVFAYMFMRDCGKAKLVECFEGTQMTHDIEFVQEEWEEIVKKTIDFTQEVLALEHKHLNEMDVE